MGRKGVVFKKTCESISPTLMPHRKAVQHGAMESPGWHEQVHEGHETGVVSGFQQVGQFTRNDTRRASSCGSLPRRRKARFRNRSCSLLPARQASRASAITEEKPFSPLRAASSMSLARCSGWSSMVVLTLESYMHVHVHGDWEEGMGKVKHAPSSRSLTVAALSQS